MVANNKAFQNKHEISKCIANLQVQRRANASEAYTCIRVFVFFTKEEHLATWVSLHKVSANTTILKVAYIY
jgi:hypothetical protein